MFDVFLILNPKYRTFVPAHLVLPGLNCDVSVSPSSFGSSNTSTHHIGDAMEPVIE